MPPKTDGTRTGASRLSKPQHVYAPDHVCGEIRAYELKLGTVSPHSAGRCASTPAAKERPSRESGASGEYMRLSEPSRSQSEKWMWQPLPATSAHGFGASDAARPRTAATPRIVSRTMICRS